MSGTARGAMRARGEDVRGKSGSGILGSGGRAEVEPIKGRGGRQLEDQGEEGSEGWQLAAEADGREGEQVEQERGEHEQDDPALNRAEWARGLGGGGGWHLGRRREGGR